MEIRVCTNTYGQAVYFVFHLLSTNNLLIGEIASNFYLG